MCVCTCMCVCMCVGSSVVGCLSPICGFALCSSHDSHCCCLLLPTHLLHSKAFYWRVIHRWGYHSIQAKVLKKGVVRGCHQRRGRHFHNWCRHWRVTYGPGGSSTRMPLGMPLVKPSPSRAKARPKQTAVKMGQGLRGRLVRTGGR